MKSKTYLTSILNNLEKKIEYRHKIQNDPTGNDNFKNLKGNHSLLILIANSRIR